MSCTIAIEPVDMTPAVMQDLEDRGLIIRLRPGAHALQAPRGQTAVRSIYESDPRHGQHKLITVTVNRSAFSAFGTHPGNEEVWLIGDPNTRPLFLVVCLHRREALDEKIKARALTAEDFVCLRVKYNDPQVSFFTMLSDTPHDEVAADGDGRSPSFYVTEPNAMGLDFTDFGDYQLKLKDCSERTQSI